MESIKGKTAIVTGGAKGFGSGISEKLSQIGADVWITGRDEKALARHAKNIGVRYFKADVADPEDWDALVEAVVNESGTVDILVNNAGYGGTVKPIEEQLIDEITRCINVNLTGVIFGCRKIVPYMKKQKSGTIINISSTCATHAWPSFSVYTAAKANILRFQSAGKTNSIRCMMK